MIVIVRYHRLLESRCGEIIHFPVFFERIAVLHEIPSDGRIKGRFLYEKENSQNNKNLKKI